MCKKRFFTPRLSGTYKAVIEGAEETVYDARIVYESTSKNSGHRWLSVVKMCPDIEITAWINDDGIEGSYSGRHAVHLYDAPVIVKRYGEFFRNLEYTFEDDELVSVTFLKKECK